jgi:DNA-binding transcriptional LysR family regulator
MDTNRLRSFCMIAETGSLTRAAEILHISHSGLSKAMDSLESEIKLKLFRPQGRGLEITAEGKWFYQKALDILKIENEISLEVQPQTNSIRIGLTEVLAITCAALITDELKEPLSLKETDVGEAEASLIANELDFGFVFSPAPRPELEYLELGQLRFNSYGRADLLKNTSPQDLPFVVPLSNLPFNPSGYKIRDGWPQEIPRHPKFAVSDFSIALNLLRAGKCVIYMPDFVADHENERLSEKLKVLKVPSHKTAETKRKLYLVKTKNSEETLQMKKTTKIFRRICSLQF